MRLGYRHTARAEPNSRVSTGPWMEQYANQAAPETDWTEIAQNPPGSGCGETFAGGSSTAAVNNCVFGIGFSVVPSSAGRAMDATIAVTSTVVNSGGTVTDVGIDDVSLMVKRVPET